MYDTLSESRFGGELEQSRSQLMPATLNTAVYRANPLGRAPDLDAVLAAAMDVPRCREIIDALPVAVYTTDADGRLTGDERSNREQHNGQKADGKNRVPRGVAEFKRCAAGVGTRDFSAARTRREFDAGSKAINGREPRCLVPFFASYNLYRLASINLGAPVSIGARSIS